MWRLIVAAVVTAGMEAGATLGAEDKDVDWQEWIVQAQTVRQGCGIAIRVR